MIRIVNALTTGYGLEGVNYSKNSSEITRLLLKYSYVAGSKCIVIPDNYL